MSKRRKRHRPEPIVKKLRETDVMLSAGQDMSSVLQALDNRVPHSRDRSAAPRLFEFTKSLAVPDTARGAAGRVGFGAVADFFDGIRQQSVRTPLAPPDMATVFP
jgi:hypothetical protein